MDIGRCCFDNGWECELGLWGVVFFVGDFWK